MSFNKITFFLMLTLLSGSCDELDEAIPDGPLIKFHFQLVNINPDHCHTINSITFVVDEDGDQSSYNVVNNGSVDFNVTVRRGELIGFLSFDTNDPTNTLLAAANIPSDNYDESPAVNNVRVYFTRCPSTDKILWISY